MNLSKTLKYLLIGRNIQIFDYLIYYLSNKNSSGWVLGNKLRRINAGKLSGNFNGNIILIGGYPRSGTTLVDALLNQHSNIISPKREVHIFEDINNPKILKDIFELDRKKINEIEKEKNLVKIAKIVIESFQKKESEKRILLKQPKHIFFLEEIFKYFPNAKYINILRDGRDCTMSQKDYCLYNGIKEWPYNWCVRQWVVAVNRADKFKDHPRYLEIKYEDLLKNPMREINEILNFLNEKPIEKTKILNYYKKTFGRYPTHENIKKPINKKKIGKGLKRMSHKSKIIFKKIAGKTLIKKGYVKNYDW